jgi:hypothetical protein
LFAEISNCQSRSGRRKTVRVEFFIGFRSPAVGAGVDPYFSAGVLLWRGCCVRRQRPVFVGKL